MLLKIENTMNNAGADRVRSIKNAIEIENKKNLIHWANYKASKGKYFGEIVAACIHRHHQKPVEER